jgi:hypothetical protein
MFGRISRLLGTALASAALVTAGGALVACDSGGSGGGSKGSSAGATAGSGGSTFTGTDTTPPALAADPASGPAAMLSGPNPVTLQGTITDTESGPGSVTVNGVAATITGTDWVAQVPLATGTVFVEVIGADVAGNQTKLGYSVIYADTLTDPRQPVTDAGKVRLTQAGLTDLSQAATTALAGANLSQGQAGQQVSFTLLNQSFTATVQQVSYGNPTVSLFTTVQGLRAQIAIPNPHATVDVPGLGNGITFDADQADVDATLFIGIAQNGSFTASVPAVNVTLTNPRSNDPTVTLAIQLQLLETLVEDMIRNQLPPAILTALNQYIAPQSFQTLGTTFTVDAYPSAIDYSANAVEVVFDANVTTPNTGTATSPSGQAGSISNSTAGSTLPTIAQDTHEAYAWSSEVLGNRGIYALWESGVLNLLVDQQFLTNLGLPTLPVNVLDGRIFALFFPQVASLLPPAGPVPLAFRLQPALPPTLTLKNAQQGASFAGSFGELRFSMAMDFGSGYTDVLTLNLFAEMDASLAISNQSVVVALGQNLGFQYRIDANPFGFNPRDVATFVNSFLPQLTNFLNAVLPPLPLPAAPSFLGVQPQNIDVRTESGYLNLRADL